MGSPDEPGMTEGYYPAASGSFSHFEAGTESIDIQLDDRSDGVDFTTI